MRVLVTVSPRLYREAIALSIQRGRLDLEVRAAPPEDAQLELAGFRPHLLVHNDTRPIPGGGADRRSLQGRDALLRQHGRSGNGWRDGLPDARHVHRKPASNGGRGGDRRRPGLAWAGTFLPYF